MSFIQQLLNIQNTYLEREGKNSIFKKSQKLDCAKNIASQFCLDDLLSKSMFIIPDTYIIYVDYTVIKLYANPDNYDYITSYLVLLYDRCIMAYHTFEIHINLKSFTISAAERYKHAIQNFSQKCMDSSMRYSEKMKFMKIYNTPSMMETISRLLKPFFDPSILEKLVLYSKDESQPLINTLLM